MICKPCSDLVGLPGKWHPHSRLKTPSINATAHHKSTPGQLLYSCSTCHSVLLKGRNTGWSLALPLVEPAPAPAPVLVLEASPEPALLTA